MVLNVLCRRSPTHAIIHQFSYPRGSHFDRGEFGQHEKCVEEYEEHGEEQIQKGHSLILIEDGRAGANLTGNLRILPASAPLATIQPVANSTPR
jgi:tRNA A37 threonylcarbamoyladenosine biosynthesis protein TsaE